MVRYFDFCFLVSNERGENIVIIICKLFSNHLLPFA